MGVRFSPVIGYAGIELRLQGLHTSIPPTKLSHCASSCVPRMLFTGLSRFWYVCYNKNNKILCDMGFLKCLSYYQEQNMIM